ncbi:MAG: serine/threonine protein kinase [Myxacorys californica WJT36-NPBG1]|jgi:serine/threonine protein kinase|nr:serine/threonine protein kinase [Myxacorys californica WJT36-NPBG1]
MLQVGQVIHDRYQLQQKLGQNAGRQTWLAVDLETQAEPVIVKLLAFGDQVQWDDLKLFEREAQILRQLEHSRIPKYRDYFSIDDRLLWFGLVYDYIPGTSLKQLIDNGKRFSEADVRKIAIAVLKILRDLHHLNPPILHRDIKPSNLILGKDDQIYLVDFGAVQDKAAKEGVTFTVVGTYGYAPMEQFGGRAVPASDLYALGATLVHLLTGTSPADLPQRNLQIQFRDAVTLSSDFATWIDHLIHPAPEARLKSAEQALQVLAHQTELLPAAAISAERNSTGLGIERPRNTKVKLIKSRDCLEIVIPKHRKNDAIEYAIPKASGIRVVMFWLGMTVVGGAIAIPTTVIGLLLRARGLQPLVWIVLCLGVIFFFLVAPWFRQTRIRFTRQQFFIEEEHFSSTTSRITGTTSDIREVRRGDRCIQITSGPYRNGYRQDRIGYELTDFEQVWLVQEIRKWLKLKQE